MTILAPLTFLSGVAETSVTTTVDKKLRGTVSIQTNTYGEPRFISGGVAYVSVGGGVAETTVEATGSPSARLGLSGTAEIVTTARKGEGVKAVFAAMESLLSNAAYAKVSGMIEPLSSSVRSPLPVPSFAKIDNVFYPMATVGRMLTGQIGQVNAMFAYIDGKASENPYAQIIAAFAPMTSKMFEGAPQNEARWYEMFYVSMPTTGTTTHSIRFDETLELDSTAAAISIVVNSIVEAVRLNTTLTGSAFITAVMAEAVRILSSVSREELFDAIALNLANNASSTYENFKFNAMTLWNGKYIASSDDGLFVLDGNTDNGSPINAALTLGLTDYGTAQKKTISYVYVGAASEEDANLTVKVDDGELYTYNLPASERVGTRRAVLGKGLRSRYWQLTVSNVSGADIEIESVDVDAAQLSRRI